jgi:hypothetical protein
VLLIVSARRARLEPAATTTAAADDLTPAPDELACKDLVELVADYLDGALAPDRKDALERHLAGCDGCVEYVDQIASTMRALQAAYPQARTAATTISID